MTTYLLHGGKTSTQNAQNNAFFAQFTQLVASKRVTVLLCYFSREKGEWDALVQRDSESIVKHSSKEVTILVAQTPEDLLSKLDRSDVLYIAGGEAEYIEPLYVDLAPIKEKLVGKVFAGSSMGMFFAAEHYVLSFDSQDSKTVHDGLGLLPIQALCHWDKEDHKEIKLKLLHERSDLPVLVLNEFEHVVMYTA
ncbi:MAG: type 1 glutamine amidotransferase-like domain-containing protein [Candidatus Pacebacteria bacterium]|nr:type 1 glutamine amidotransferase-like domain-containing protein [Candidatus Paceibacterota bacterium]PIR63435.1 MAG: hypothetical protein COU64_04530 [Candidatus Pacebacteria bacterium CG10_big_fil_rev_8_21_14_0_10_40_26]PIZ79574.1 MAG: hypothetical protein COY01_00435 [Candidatus Pacebacteria bacterium CG_4_10_14_0_2_um_filter_40_20]PJA69027.1 MAG: hypothetical protein CO156_01685 [Candidatus Pacebacteria bacterium CG_4_9_14_3_um_filter_40_12]PJC41840.1 MAG: hypothetical protein CO041_0392